MSAAPAGDLAPLELPALETLAPERLERMLAAGEDVLECQRVLRKGGLNVVGEVLAGQGKFFEYDHFPKGDVYDKDTHAQYYYHAHRGMAGEHGHFHTFLRRAGMPAGVAPVPHGGETRWPSGADAVTHLVAISMDAYGYPIGFFATNRWVTDEAWFAAGDVIAMLDRFEIDHAYPSWPSNRWIGAMLRLFEPQVAALLRQRDAVVAAWAERHPGADVFEDRALEVTGELRVSVNTQVATLRGLLGRPSA